ncbi:MAG: hypothetical protein ABIJ34_03640 [archaeon]
MTINKKQLMLALMIVMAFAMILALINKRTYSFIFYCYVFCLFLFTIFFFKSKAKLHYPNRLIIGCFISIITYLVLKALTLFYPKTLPEMEVFYNLSAIWDSNLVNLIVISLSVTFTYMMFSEMRRERERAETPIIIARPEQIGVGSLVCLAITNISKSIAYNVSATYSILSIEGTEYVKNWYHSIMQPSERIELVIGEEGMVKFLEDNQLLNFNITFNDDKDRIYKKNIKFELIKILEGIKEANWLIPEDNNEKLREKIKDISSTLMKIETQLRYLADESKDKYNTKHKAIIEQVRKHRDTKET